MSLRSDLIKASEHPQKTVYLLIADDGWARLYSTESPFAELSLVSHRINYVGGASPASTPGSAAQPQVLNHNHARHIEDFCRSVCRAIRLEYQAGKFNCLLIMASSSFLAAMRDLLDSDCGDRVFEKVVDAPRQLADKELLSHVRDCLAGCAVLGAYSAA